MSDFMKFQQNLGSGYLNIQAYLAFGVFLLFAVFAVVMGVVPWSKSCTSSKDCTGTNNTCSVESTDKPPELPSNPTSEDLKKHDAAVQKWMSRKSGKCSKSTRHYWLIAVAVGLALLGYGLFRLLKAASKSKELSTIAGFGAEADMASSILGSFRFKSSRRKKSKA